MSAGGSWRVTTMRWLEDRHRGLIGPGRSFGTIGAPAALAAALKHMKYLEAPRVAQFEATGAPVANADYTKLVDKWDEAHHDQLASWILGGCYPGQLRRCRMELGLDPETGKPDTEDAEIIELEPSEDMTEEEIAAAASEAFTAGTPRALGATSSKRAADGGATTLPKSSWPTYPKAPVIDQSDEDITLTAGNDFAGSW